MNMTKIWDNVDKMKTYQKDQCILQKKNCSGNEKNWIEYIKIGVCIINFCLWLYVMDVY